MKLDELGRIAMENLRRTRLRTTLTTLGVIIGIGALVSMMSFGIGTQRNVTAAFYENDLFTSMLVSPVQVDMDKVINGDIQGVTNALYKPPPPLTDSSLIYFESLPDVEMVFPEIRFPVKLRMGNETTQTQLRAMPARMGEFKPFNDLMAGSFFKNDSEQVIILNPKTLKDLNIQIREHRRQRLSLEDSLRRTRLIDAGSLIGDSLEIVTSIVDLTQMNSLPALLMRGRMELPFTEKSMKFKIAGIQKPGTGFNEQTLLSGAVIPLKTAESMPRLGFNNIWDILGGKHNEGYSSAIVRVRHIDHVSAVQDSIEMMGYTTFSMMDQLNEMKKVFLIFDMGLGAVGTIALIVAALGIINTMIMSILERTREIGIMKAIGGSEGEIRTIFFIEAGIIGFIGGICGLALGWLVTKIANAVANVYFLKEVDFTVNLFYIPLWLILSAIGFSIAISLIAGIYPASRAAAVNPVEALRHD